MHLTWQQKMHALYAAVWISACLTIGVVTWWAILHNPAFGGQSPVPAWAFFSLWTLVGALLGVRNGSSAVETEEMEREAQEHAHTIFKDLSRA